MRVLILWASDTSPNLGVRALATGAARLVSCVDPSTDIDFIDFSPHVDAENQVRPAFGLRSTIQDLARLGGPLRQQLREYDAIIDTGGGDSFTDIYGTKRLFVIHYFHQQAAIAKVPLLMAPQTIGPFNSRVGTALGKRSLHLAGAVTTRDPVSHAVASRFGVRPTEATDLVFQLPQPPASTQTKGRVLLNVSGLLWQENPHVSFVAYRNAVEQLFAALSIEGLRPMLFPHVLDSPSRDNDVAVLPDVIRRLGPDTEVALPKDLEQARSMASSALLVIASRMHASLNSLSVGTPAISWAYSRKFKPLLERISWRHTFDLRDADDPVPQTLRLAIEFASGAALSSHPEMEATSVAIELQSSRLREHFGRLIFE